MRVLHVALLAALLLGADLAAGPRAAKSSDWWCWDDPVLVINNQAVHVLAGVPETERRRVRMAEVTVIVPEGVDARLVASAASRFPLTARLVRAGAVAPDGAVLITALMTVQADGEFPTALRLRQASGGEQTGFGTVSRPAISTISLLLRSNAAVRVAPQGAPPPR